MKIIVAMDSFKGSLTSLQAGEAVMRGLKEHLPDAQIQVLQIADGGEGSLKAIAASGGYLQMQASAVNPRGSLRKAEFLMSGGHAVIELASASGMNTLSPDDLNPLLTSTYGTGQLIKNALRLDCRQITLCVGGSATNDGGMGLLSALGYRFLDSESRELQPCGGNLIKIAIIDNSQVLKELKDTKFTVACDVDAPFIGPNGATRVFGPQKGATPEMIEQLEAGMTHFADLTEQFTGVRLHDLNGAGAAGGVSGAMKAYLGAEFRPGVEIILDALNFNDIIRNAELVITGEGRMDAQSLMGKAPVGILRRCQARGIPVVGFAGSVENPEALIKAGFRDVLPIQDGSRPLQEMMRTPVATANLQNAAAQFALGLSASRP